MLEDLIDLVASTFPSIEPYKAERSKESLRIFLKGRDRIDLAAKVTTVDLLQGDIIDSLVTFFVSDDGELRETQSKAFIISNSCDIENDDFIIICRCYDYEEFVVLYPHIDKVSLRKNVYAGLMFVTCNDGVEYIIDFTSFSTYSKNLIFKLLKNERIRRLAKLNDIGWYIMIVKLTYYLLRPEDDETKTVRK
jgi:hypothetical protein